MQNILMPTEENIPLATDKLLPLLSKILPSYTQNPEPLADLSIKILRPMDFTQTLTIVSDENLILALQSPLLSAKLLGINILSKASSSPSHTAALSALKSVVAALIRTWLSSPEVEVGEAATRVLGDLLEVDCECRKSFSSGLISRIKDLNLELEIPSGQGLLWRRIFHDQDIYKLLFSLTGECTSDSEECRLDKRQRTLAQGRLLRLLPRLSVLNFQMITQSHFPLIEQLYGNDASGLLPFAMINMVDKKDLLMHITLIIFFGELLSLMSRTTLSPSALALLSSHIKKAASNDFSLKDSLETTASDPRTPPELLDLLSRLAIA